VLDDSPSATEPRLHYPYFPSAEPLAFPVHGSYADPSAHVDQPVEYGWVHSLGEVVTVLAQAGLRIEFLHEYQFTVFRQFPFVVQVEREPPTYRLPGELDGRLPLLFSLKASRPPA
jgi:hypothetical protein